MTENPCRYCVDDRTATCHATCERYADWVVIHSKEIEEIRLKKKLEKDTEDYLERKRVKYKKVHRNG